MYNPSSPQESDGWTSGAPAADRATGPRTTGRTDRAQGASADRREESLPVGGAASAPGGLSALETAILQVQVREVEESLDATLLTDGEGLILAASPRLHSALGWESGSLAGLLADEVIVPPDAADELVAMRESLLSAEVGADPYTWEGYVVCSDRSRIRARMQGRRVGIAGNNALWCAFEPLPDLLGLATGDSGREIDGVLVVDREGIITTANRQAEELFGYSHGDLVGRRVETLVPDDVAEHHSQLREAQGYGAKGPLDLHRTVRGRRQDGSVIPLEVHLSELEGSGDVGVCAVLRDLSGVERRQHEADAARSDFIHTVHRELRAPLTSMIGLAERIEGSAEAVDASMVSHFVDVVTRNARRELHLVEDLLLVTAVQAGTVVVTPQPCHARGPVLSAISDRAEAAVHRRVGVDVDLRRAPAVSADSELLRKCVDQLVSNAMKFASAGGTVVCTWRAEEDDLVLTISNPVSSIDQATLERAFDPWFRGSAAADEQAPGSGLGLVIARGLARLMGGDVALRVENAVSDPVGGGARLAPVVHAELTLPLA